MDIAERIVKSIVDNYNYGFAQYQPSKIKSAIDLIDPEISSRLDYSNSETLIQSIRKEVSVDITPFIVKHGYPVWTDVLTDVVPDNRKDRLVITYLPPDKSSFNGCIDRIRDYASRVNADFIVLNGRTQGSVQLEKSRIKRFVEAYERTLFLNYHLILAIDCPDLFEMVPEGKVGIYDNAVKLEELDVEIKRYKKKRLVLLKADAFSRFPILTQAITEPLEFESEQIDTMYSNNVVVCSKQHAGIWNPISFPYPQSDGDDQVWMETLIYRDGYDVFTLPADLCFHESVFDGIIKDDISNAKIISYKNFVEESNIKNTWLYDNNITGYKNKPELNMDDFSLVCLGHSDKQFDSIQDRNYLSKINLNQLQTSFGNEFAEGRIFDVDFDSLFPKDKKYVGLVTASWNRKYIGLNPIDELNKWAGIRELSANKILCSNTEYSSRFLSSMMDVLRIDFNKCQEFLDLIGLDLVSKHAAISNQIIATREIVKQLFDFYKENDVLNKIQLFVSDNIPEAKMFDERKEGCLSEFVTTFWIANQDFIILPQEIRKINWYW